MIRTIFIILFILTFYFTNAQPKNQVAGKIFWSEDFSHGKMPNGWILKSENDSNVLWEITDQPYPSSFGHDQQAPPIASKSRGFHMQFAPGVIVDRFYRKWEKSGLYPDAWIMTSPIDCSRKKSVVLTFQQNFMWNNWTKSGESHGLFVGVSNNGIDWIDEEVRYGIGTEEDCPNPMNVELNITATAAFQKTVYLRFYWKGIHAWYWMIDDIALSEALDYDLLASSLVSHPETGNEFTNSDVFKFNVVNLSSNEIKKPFDAYLGIDNLKKLKVTIPFSEKKKFSIIDTVQVIFPAVDLTDFGIHEIRFYTSFPEEMRKENDTISMLLYSRAYKLGKITDILKTGDEYFFMSNRAQIKINFCRTDMFHIQMAYNGEFTNPAGNDIIINIPDDKPNVDFSDNVLYYLLQTKEISLRVYKDPLRFALYKSDNKTLIWEETESMSYGKETVQYIKRGNDEYFYGGGMQNGRFSHRDKTILLQIDWNWEDGGAPNPAPFYMSTKGYGALRNTYAPGRYAFKDTLRLSHNEARFDCYYFTGETLKNILGDYTDLTGKPFLPPRWALSLGDANCYNRGANKSKNSTGYKGLTPDVIPLIADKYIENNMPRGWILPNDGYGCGYTRLDSVVVELRKRGFRTGLWTENGVDKIAKEVGEYGSRLCKLDVAWVGYGYKFAIDGCKAAYEGIEKNSDARGFVWSVCGWAGTHRNSVVWTGDQKGSWDYIRWHIPTLVGCGLSAQNAATGDVDGIFGGSDKTYTRDLQWKCFTPVFMSMSGWAPKDKQPYVYGEPYTSINRKYLMLKMQLTPYMYTLCNEAWESGVPAVRALTLEYPDDSVVKGTQTNYQFLLGQNLLIAPVYKDSEIRDCIYLPEGKWIDFWDGTIFEGSRFLNNYSAPLEKLPLFVKQGSIIPMYPPMYYDGEREADTLTLAIYPGIDANFEMFEDEGSNREYRIGKFSKTLFSAECEGPDNRLANIKLGQAKGSFNGMPEKRVYLIQIHTQEVPKKVYLEKFKLKKVKNRSEFGKASKGWYFAPHEKSGILYIKTSEIPTKINTAISLIY